MSPSSLDKHNILPNLIIFYILKHELLYILGYSEEIKYLKEKLDAEKQNLGNFKFFFKSQKVFL